MVGSNDFDGDLPMKPFIVRKVDFTHAPASKHLYKAVLGKLHSFEEHLFYLTEKW
ncbi:MAG: hypothetical protein NVS4B7_04780 [Ktedonobacteraceae bacterium]